MRRYNLKRMKMLPGEHNNYHYLQSQNRKVYLYLGFNTVLQAVFFSVTQPFQICRCVHDNDGIK